MNKSDLLNRLGIRSPYLNSEDTTQALNLILKALSDALIFGNKIEIRGFASFCTKIRSARKGRNPKNGMLVKVPAKRTISFKAGAILNKRLNDK